MRGARGLVLGALAGDAAALGLHWIYDPERIVRIAGKQPEFREPDEAAYRGTTAYFAHGGKQAGDPTHYGEQLLVALRSLAATGGVFDAADYERRFCDTFGPGGSWVGYIDYATRVTLRNTDRAGLAAIEAARAFDLGRYAKDRALMVSKVMANAQRWRGEQLARAMDKAVRVTHGEDAELMRLGRAMARAVENARGGPHGSDDVQLPAVSKLSALVAFDADDAAIERAVRATNDNDASVRWARPVAQALRAARDGAGAREAAEAARDADPELLEAAFAFRGEDPGEAFGRACPLDQAVSVWLVALRDAEDYVATMRRNLLLGGDNAGRATILGAALGAIFGVPEAWLARTRAATEASALLAETPA